MNLRKNRSNIFIFLLKNFFIIFGLNLLLTSLFTVIKIELKNNLQSKMNVNNKKLKYDHKVQFDLDIY